MTHPADTIGGLIIIGTAVLGYIWYLLSRIKEAKRKLEYKKNENNYLRIQLAERTKLVTKMSHDKWHLWSELEKTTSDLHAIKRELQTALKTIEKAS